MVTVDLGCGTNKRGDIGIDFFPYPGVDIVCNLGFESIPIKAEYVDRVLAYDLLEHIPFHAWLCGVELYPVSFLFSEVWRILKPGGVFETLTPIWPYEHIYAPTHKSIWTEDTIKIFCCGGSEKLKNLFKYPQQRLFHLDNKNKTGDNKLFAVLRK